MDNIHRIKIGYILANIGYCDKSIVRDDIPMLFWYDGIVDNMVEDIQPFKDTLVGRRQLDCMFDWLTKYHNDMMVSATELEWGGSCYFNRIHVCRYCLDNLTITDVKV